MLKCNGIIILFLAFFCLPSMSMERATIPGYASRGPGLRVHDLREVRDEALKEKMAPCDCWFSCSCFDNCRPAEKAACCGEVGCTCLTAGLKAITFATSVTEGCAGVGPAGFGNLVAFSLNMGASGCLLLTFLGWAILPPSLVANYCDLGRIEATNLDPFELLEEQDIYNNGKIIFNNVKFLKLLTIDQALTLALVDLDQFKTAVNLMQFAPALQEPVEKLLQLLADPKQLQTSLHDSTMESYFVQHPIFFTCLVRLINKKTFQDLETDLNSNLRKILNKSNHLKDISLRDIRNGALITTEKSFFDEAMSQNSMIFSEGESESAKWTDDNSIEMSTLESKIDKNKMILND